MRIAVFILALAVRIAAIEWTGADTLAFGDAPDYVNAARTLCIQHEYPERGNLPFFRAPGLPFFMAAVTGCHPDNVRLVKYGLALCDAITVLLIMMLAAFVSKDSKRALIAGLLATFHPFFVGSVTDIRTEPLFMMLLVASLLFLVRRQHALAGVAVALAALVRPTGLLCIPLFALFAWRRAHVVLLAAALTLSPWVARNVVRFGEPIVVNDASGFNLWRGTHPELMQVVETTDRNLFAQRSVAFETRTVPAAVAAVDARAKTPGERDRTWRALALQQVRGDPGYAFRSTLKKAALYWRPWLHPGEHGPKTIALSVVVILGLYLLGGLGLWQHPDRRLVLAVLLFFAAMWLAHVPYFPSIRLRMPLTDPLLIVFAAGPVVMLLTRLRRFLPLAPIVVPIVAVAFVATRLGDFPAARAAIATMQGAAGEWWSLPLFVLAYTLFTVFLLPVGLLSAAATLMWGWKLGAAVELATLSVASLLPFVLARRGLSGFVERRIDRRDLPALDSPFNLFLLRVVPVVPFVALNYIAGATRIRTRDYVLVTLAGSIPSAVLFAYFVDTLAGSAMGVATQAKIVAACVLIAAAAIILRLAARRVARRT
ncbi:MAG TPA: VTT domain-containing protein [Thermoanaerobaculia bacterium]|nr:VTT domain-containing protein [Thermoanaerobaculia bacterium]